MDTIKNSTANNLIARSISHTEIVHAEWTPELDAGLTAECDDNVDASETVREFWGTTEGGAEWRVHLTGERVLRYAHGEGVIEAGDYVRAGSDYGIVWSIDVAAGTVVVGWTGGIATPVDARALRWLPRLPEGVEV